MNNKRVLSPKSTSSATSIIIPHFSPNHQKQHLNEVFNLRNLSPSPNKKSKLQKIKQPQPIPMTNSSFGINSFYTDRNNNQGESEKFYLKRANYVNFTKLSDVCIELGEVIENDVELGEVTIDKIKNPALIDCEPPSATVKLPTQLITMPQRKETPYSTSSSPMSATSNSKTPELVIDAVFTAEEDIPVTISKKILPMVTPRILDWLEKSVDFINKLSVKSNIDLKKLFDLLTRAWPKLLIVYMIENSFDFFVTPDHNKMIKIVADLQQQDTNSDEDKKNLKHAADKLPKEKDAQQILNIISKGNSFNLKTKDYDDLREIVLFKEGKRI
jgi:hypothetical protein